ncbi:MAG: HAMP domain-containing protein, partial [Chloroflexi bacterium]|nr:HAMP domain-containing protein [Chloroflexota bacterium]
IFAALVLATPVTSMLLGLRLPAWNALPLPGVTLEPGGLALMIFSALPWVLAAGLLGPIPAAVLAAFSGFLLAYWDTHSIFSPVEMALLATLFATSMGQRYRTPIFRGLRHPLGAAVVLSLLYPAIFMLNTLLVAGGSLAGQIDYALTHVVSATLAVGVPLVVAGLFAEIIKLAFPALWGGQPPWRLSPAESSLEARFIRNMVPLALVLTIVLMVGDWVVAGNAARQMLQDRMLNAAQTAAEGVPYFLDAGQSLILQLASNPDLKSNSPDELTNILESDLRSIPFFRQLFVLDARGEPLAGYPVGNFYDVTTVPEEQVGIELALSGVLIQVYTLAPLDGETAAQVSFLAAILDETEMVQGVLIGRADLDSNPFTQPILASLRSMSSVGGEGFLLDENGRILYHSDENRLMLPYPSSDFETAVFYDDTAPDGTRQLAYYQPAVGRPWAVVLTVPAQRAQQMALNIASPLLGMIVLLSLIAIGLMRVGLRMVTSSLQSLAVEADRIARGQLDHVLQVDGGDEVGQLRRSFEKMRLSLSSRLDELNRLLLVSQGVAASLEMETAVQPILESALATGACSARVVLTPAVIPETGKDPSTPSRFGLGQDTEAYSYFDEQILTLMLEHERIVLTTPVRTTLLNFGPGAPQPEALLAVALRHENIYYGILWAGYDKPHSFTNEEVRFLTTLAGQAVLAATNARLFLTAEFERQRLAAILSSTPDPVLVTDHRDYLLLVNPAAWQALGMGADIRVEQPVEDAIAQPELIQLLRSSVEEKESLEVTLPDGRVYLATASSIVAESQIIGRVCVLRDVTHFKELDALKSDFVSTVSHDLRSPLTLMRGYATMLEMVGDLNNQQAGYVRKIVVGVESMSRLVNNLLDLGRIEAEVGLQLEMLPVRDIVEEVTGTLNLQAAQKRIKLHTAIRQPSVPLIEADRALLQQAFYNLVENAIKYTPEGGDVWVNVKTLQDRLVFEVRDTGIGISRGDQHRLFEKFYRSANREAKKERGTGLGLAIVKSIAERHKGRVWVESQLGQGTTFFFEISLRHTR